MQLKGEISKREIHVGWSNRVAFVRRKASELDIKVFFRPGESAIYISNIYKYNNILINKSGKISEMSLECFWEEIIDANVLTDNDI